MREHKHSTPMVWYLQALLCLFVFFPVSVYSQSLLESTVTRAVVVGISDYQDERIPDLTYAKKDAEAFAQYLQSPAGGQLSPENVKLLTNEQATTAQIAAALIWLIEESKENDEVVIYFSGHGDVETKMRSQPGFLLTWDSPFKMYIVAALSVLDLQEIVSTLSLQNKAKVRLIIDACRSGKLAGHEVRGSQLTNANLSQQFANEVKLLSCQHDEYSIEGKQWGGGRGAFSYHLVEGLCGLADLNKDLEVSLSEINRYLEDHVSPEVAPLSQIPLAVGNRNEVIALVDEEVLERIKTKKESALPKLSRIDSKGMAEELLAQVDSLLHTDYHAFQEAIQQKQFFEPEGTCADDLYRKLIKEPSLEPLHDIMRRKYAVALQEDFQQMINTYLNATHRKYDPDQEARIEGYGRYIKELHIVTSRGADFQARTQRYQRYVKQLEVAIELIGENHFMHDPLVSRRFYLQALVEYMTNGYAKGEDGPLKYLKKSLEYEPNAAYTHAAFAVYFLDIQEATEEEIASGFEHALEAIDLSPTWGFPYFIASFYYEKMGKPEEARSILEEAVNQNPESPFSQRNWGNQCVMDQNWEAAETAFDQVLALDSTYVPAYRSLFTIYKMTDRLEEAKQLIPQLLALQNPEAYFTAASFELDLGDAEAAQDLFERYLDTSQVKTRFQKIGWEWMIHGGTDLAKQYFEKALDQYPEDANPYFDLGWLHFSNQDADQALAILKKGIKKHPKKKSIQGLYGIISFMEGDTVAARQTFESIQMLPAYEALQSTADLSNESAVYDQLSELYLEYPDWWLERFFQYPLVKREILKEDTEFIFKLFKQPDLLVFNYQLLNTDPIFEEIRETAEFKKILKQQFPGNQ